MSGETSQLRDETGEERLPESGLLVHQALERGAAEDLGLRRLERDGGGGVWRAVDQGQLAKEVATEQRGDDGGLLALGRGKDDLDRARLEDEQRIAGITLVEDRLVAAEPAQAEVAGAQGEGVVVDLGEQRAASKRLEGEFVVDGARHAGTAALRLRAVLSGRTPPGRSAAWISGFPCGTAGAPLP